MIFLSPFFLKVLAENDNLQLVKSKLVDSKPIYTFDDFEYTIDDDSSVTLIKYVGDSADIEIPNQIRNKSVISVGNNCFENYTKVNSVVLPDSIVSVGDGCFSGCLTLKTIILPSSLIYIGDNCFNNCSMLKQVSFPRTMKHFGNNIFSSCDKLDQVTIPYDVSELGGSNFTRTSYFNNKILGTDIQKFSSNDGVTFTKNS